MKKMILGVLIILSSCATPMKPERVKMELENTKMPLLAGEPICKYEILSPLFEKTYDEDWGNVITIEEATLNLKKKAQLLNANAVINFKTSALQSASGMLISGMAVGGSTNYPVVSGLAIRCIDGKKI